MKLIRILLLLALGIGLGAAGQYWYALQSSSAARSPTQAPSATAADRPILYYRDPSGSPRWSAVPKKDEHGRDYLPVYDDEEPSFDAKPTPAKSAKADRKVLYYRNPMGLPDTSPVPKKDSMGMDYVPVYEGEEQDGSGTIKVSLDKVQRSGVRTEKVARRTIVRPIRAVGAVDHDESRQTIVTVRADGFIEDLFVSKTGQHVHAGDPLFRIYSPDIQTAQINLIVSVGAARRGSAGLLTGQDVEGAVQRLRNLAVPESRIREIRETGANPRTLDWPSPATGDVIEKRVINGQRVRAGDDLFRISDHSHVWVIAEVAESDLSAIAPGTRATITLRADQMRPVEAEVTFIYPELRTETRTARVRIELPNPDGWWKIGMYADVVFQAGAGEPPVTAVPASAVIDSGSRQIVLVAKGEGRFEPRRVKLGRRGDGYVEILNGVSDGEEVVTSANFLIDAESNLRTALQGFAQPEASK
jgi:Cu(I)/Ag(I) efflux system membrane fusion protein